MQPTPLSVVIRAALADKGINTLRDAAEALRDNTGNYNGLSKDGLRRRFNGDASWTAPDLERIGNLLGISVSKLYAKTEEPAA